MVRDMRGMRGKVLRPTEMVRDMRGMRGKVLRPTEMVRDMRGMRGKVLGAAGNRCAVSAVSCPLNKAVRLCGRKRLISPLFYQDGQKWIPVSRLGVLAACGCICSPSITTGTAGRRGSSAGETIVVLVRYGRMILLRKNRAKPTIPRAALARKHLRQKTCGCRCR
jgi:hypothetical protein